MNVLVLNPSRAGQGQIPLNVPLLIACLRRRGHQVRLFDLGDYDCFSIQDYESRFFKPTELSPIRIVQDRATYTRNLLPIPPGTELRKTDYGKDFATVLDRFRPQLIAVSCLSIDFPFARDFLARFASQHSAKIIFGGIHAILMPDQTLNLANCDIVCLGEGENVLPAVADALETGRGLDTVVGISYKENGKIHHGEPAPLTDLATLPPPDLSDYDPIHFYRPFNGRRHKMINYEFSRGCPFRCTYCVNGVLQDRYRGKGKYHRHKTISQSITELQWLVQLHGFEFIRFWDEDFASLSVRVIREYADAYRKEIRLPFLVYARVDTIQKEKVAALQEMGCVTIAMGIECGDEAIRRKVLNRHISDNTIRRAFAMVKAAGIRVSAYNMMGFPGESRETILKTAALNREVDPDAFSITLLEPYRGTPIRKLCEDQGLSREHETTWNAVQFVPPGMTKEELLGMYRTFAFYVRLPRERFPEIGEAERNDVVYQRLQEEYLRRL